MGVAFRVVGLAVDPGDAVGLFGGLAWALDTCPSASPPGMASAAAAAAAAAAVDLPLPAGPTRARARWCGSVGGRASQRRSREKSCGRRRHMGTWGNRRAAKQLNWKPSARGWRGHRRGTNARVGLRWWSENVRLGTGIPGTAPPWRRSLQQAANRARFAIEQPA